MTNGPCAAMGPNRDKHLGSDTKELKIGQGGEIVNPKAHSLKAHSQRDSPTPVPFSFAHIRR